jgi:hypothetical protein
MTPYHALRLALRSRQGIATTHELRIPLAAYLASLRSSKPLGEGDLCCVDTKGNVKMMTRAEYAEMVYGRRKKPRKKRNKDGDLVLEYVAQDSVEVEAVLTANFIVSELVTQHSKDTDWIDDVARQQEEEIAKDAYFGEF